MSEPIRILVADRNRHVRELLRRELAAEGYLVQVAKDGQEVELALNGREPPHLLILDLEIPYLEEVEALPQLRGRPAQLPVIIHSFPPDAPDGPQALPVAAFLEKKEDTDRLKELVAQVLGRPATRLKSAG